MAASTNHWRIRKATSDDLPAVLQLYDAAVVWLNAQGITEQWGTTPVSERSHLVAEISDFLHYGMVAEDTDIQGFIAVNSVTPDDFSFHAEPLAVMDGGYVHTGLLMLVA
jgi:L-amino acid N-acyltransferase YncA